MSHYVYTVCSSPGIDPKKNRSNKRDHGGFDFPLASLVFNDPRYLVEFDQVDEYGEERLLAIGRLPTEQYRW